MFWSLLYAVLALVTQSGQEPPARPVAAAEAPLSPAAKAALNEWRAAFAQARRAYETAGHATVQEELSRRVTLEQAGRRALTPIMRSVDLAEPEKRRVLAAAWAELTPVDEDNVRWLKSALPADGWFRVSRDGKAATRNAWLIVQHATFDRPFQKQVLAVMEPLVDQGEVSGGDYALLFDRVSLAEGRPQRYGSQGPMRRWRARAGQARGSRSRRSTAGEGRAGADRTVQEGPGRRRPLLTAIREVNPTAVSSMRQKRTSGAGWRADLSMGGQWVKVVAERQKQGAGAS